MVCAKASITISHTHLNKPLSLSNTCWHVTCSALFEQQTLRPQITWYIFHPVGDTNLYIMFCSGKHGSCFQFCFNCFMLKLLFCILAKYAVFMLLETKCKLWRYSSVNNVSNVIVSLFMSTSGLHWFTAPRNMILYDIWHFGKMEMHVIDFCKILQIFRQDSCS